VTSPDGLEEGFAARFARLREATGLTKSALAAPRYTLSYVSQIESAKRVPSGESLAYFADRLGVSVSYLQSGVPDGLDERLGYRLEEVRAILRSGDPGRALNVARDVRTEAERFALTPVRAQALVLSGDALAMLGRTREAIDRYEDALEGGLTEREHGTATAALASAYRTVGDLSYAISLIESKLKESADTPLDPGVSADLHSVLLSIYFERGDITKAGRVAQQALKAASEGASPQSRANVLWAASRVLAEAKRWDEALELARNARMLIEGLSDQLRLARVHSANAYLCLETDPPRLDEAEDHLAHAEALLGPGAPPQELAYVYSEQGRLALLSGRAAEALERSEIAFANVTDDPLQRAGCLFLRGRAMTELSRLDEALDNFYEAAAIFDKTGARQQVATCYREIGEIKLRVGDLEAVVEAFREGLEALDPRRSRA
jgi:tetratricopeptide (TPR) repeat protein